MSLPQHKVQMVGEFGALAETVGWNVADLKIPAAWSSTKGESVAAMVIDTGFSGHVDISENEIEGPSFIRGQKCLDLHGHGSHCAGIIGAMQNSEGVVGVAPKSKVISVKALSNNGLSDESAIRAALKYALETKPDVINLSLGTSSPLDRDTVALIQQLYLANIPVVCAAGNNGVRGGIQYPGKYNECIAVGAFDQDRKIADFSAKGPEVDFIAPGVDILSTYKDNQYAVMTGTSMAAPFVTGWLCLLISLIKAKYGPRYATVKDLRSIMYKACDPVSDKHHGQNISAWHMVTDQDLSNIGLDAPMLETILPPQRRSLLQRAFDYIFKHTL